MPFLTILEFSCLLAAFITFGLGIYVYAKNPASSVNRQFIAVMFATTYWAIGEFLIWHTGTYEGVWFWLKFSSLWPFVVAFTAHFILSFTGHPLSGMKRSWLLVAILYIPATVLSLLGFLTSTLYSVAFVQGQGWVYLPVQGSIAYHAEAIYSFLVMAWAAYVAFSSWRTTPAGKVRRQCRLVFIGIAIIIGFGTLSGVILPAFGIYTPNLTFIGAVIFALIITYAILTYGLFVLSPETAVPDIIRAMPDGMILSDMDGKIIAANAAAAGILSTQEEAILGREVGYFIPSQEYEAIGGAILDRGIVTDMEVVLGQDTPKTVSIAGALVKEPAGDPAGIVLIIRDITTRKASEIALRIANEKISLLSEVTRHDISNLVTALSAYLELMREDRDDPACEAYLNSSIGLVEKIGRHLQFTHMYQDIGANQPIWQALGDLVSHAIDDVPHEGIGIFHRLGHVEIFADPLVVRVISNLLDNAIRHGQTLTTIHISTDERPDKELVLIIEDDGVGISREEKKRIFDYGYGRHTGLGLGISRDILSLTGITIEETGEEGMGARFEIHIPAHAWRSLLPG